MKLDKDRLGIPTMPEIIPSDPKDLISLMDDAAECARHGQGETAPKFDHSMRVFKQLNAHFQIAIEQRLSKAHQDLSSATKGLKVATWWLAAITVLLGAVELLNLASHMGFLPH